MRDPNRIRPFLDELERVWMTNPDLRFGQLVENIVAGIEYPAANDVFVISDDIMLERLLGLDFSPAKIAGKYRGEV